MKMKLGKLYARYDRRTLQIRDVLKKLPPLPVEWDFDVAHPKVRIPLPMFGNDTYGDCVIAGRAHWTLRAEVIEQAKAISITTNDVTKEYFKESGGQDNGLVMLDSLNLWRRNGWKVAGQTYNIDAFGQVNVRNQDEVKATIYLLYAAYTGFALPLSAQKQINANKIWDVMSGPSGKPGSWGGHCFTIKKYTNVGPCCITWGTEQPMTWAFFLKYCDECFAVVDNKDKFLGAKSPIDVKKLEAYLAEVIK